VNLIMACVPEGTRRFYLPSRVQPSDYKRPGPEETVIPDVLRGLSRSALKLDSCKNAAACRHSNDPFHDPTHEKKSHLQLPTG
jgi:hypothetical protein